MLNNRKSGSILLAAAVVGCTDAAFVVQPSQGTTKTTALHLLPSQASDLVAASNSVYQPKEDFDEGDWQDFQVETGAKQPQGQVQEVGLPATTAARAFVSKVFNIPSSNIQKHPHPISEGLHALAKAQEDATVGELFPITGCRLVQDAPDHYRTLPSMKHTNPSCRLPNLKEELVGWFRPAESEGNN